MKYFATAAALSASFAGVALAQGPTITTPASLVVCQPAAITVSGGQAPYIISALPGGQASAAALEQIGTQATPGSFTWKVNLPVGTSITLSVRDGAGNINYSQIVQILTGPDTSCVGQAASVSGSAAAPGTSAVSAASSAISSAGSAVSSAASSAASGASSVSSAASGSATSSVASRVSSLASAASSAVNSATSAAASAARSSGAASAALVSTISLTGFSVVAAGLVGAVVGAMAL